MIDIHRNGWTEDIFDKAERASYQKTMFYTFQDRFDAVCELLTVRASLKLSTAFTNMSTVLEELLHRSHERCKNLRYDRQPSCIDQAHRHE